MMQNSKYGSIEYVLERLEAMKLLAMEDIKTYTWITSSVAFEQLFCRFTGMMEVLNEDATLVKLTNIEIQQALDKMYKLIQELRHYQTELQLQGVIK